MDTSAILALLGGISLLSAIIGGGIEAERIKIPSISTKLRIVLAIIGVTLVGTAVWMSISPGATPTGAKAPESLPVTATPRSPPTATKEPEPSPATVTPDTSEQSYPPEITNVLMREDTSAGSLIIYQDVFFQDRDGDAYLIDWDLVSTTASNVTLNDSYIERSAKEQVAGTFHTASWECGDGIYTVTLRGTVYDRAGNQSEPVEYTLECRSLVTPTPTLTPTPTPTPIPTRLSFADTYEGLFQERYYIKQVAFAGYSGWVILYDTSGVYSYGIPKDASNKLSELSNAGEDIKTVAFTSDLGWVIIYGRNQAVWRDIPEDAASRLDDLVNREVEIKMVAFTDDSGWVILLDRADAWWSGSGVPSDATEKIRELGDAGENIKAIAFTGDSGWVILYGRNQAVWRDIPEDAASRLDDLVNREVEIKTIAFTRDSGWIILLGRADSWRSRTPP